MTIGILGAGISGLSIARLLSIHFEVEILEKEDKYGGIAKVKEIDGISYHTIGGHCFNSKHADVMEFVFNSVLKKYEWNLINRNACVRLHDNIISYPIEYAIKEIFLFNEKLALEITKDFLNASDDGLYSNLEEWFRKKFGDKLSEIYFLPYNRKIWGMHSHKMSYEWVKDKLPIPDKKSFFKNIFIPQNDKMPHHCFYYPKSNTQNTFIDALAKGIDIKLNYKVESISYDNNLKKWKINEDKTYDIVINTLPLNILPHLIENVPDDILKYARQLKYNKITTALWESKYTERTWTYIPEPDSIFHRYIHIGNFFNPHKNYTITEAIGEKSIEEIHKHAKKDSFLIKMLDFNISDHAYVVYDSNHQKATQSIKKYLSEVGLYTLGRFGEWEYYNMDICIKRGMELSEILVKKHVK